VSKQNDEQAVKAVQLMIDILIQLMEQGKIMEVNNLIETLDPKVGKYLVAVMLGEIAYKRGVSPKKAKAAFEAKTLQQHLDEL
jgi:hypothetical protein